MMNIDLHLHTTFSDGILTPEQLLDECAKRNIKKAGICDHWGTRKYSSRFQVTDIASYVKALSALRARYKEPEVHIGLEVDFSNAYGAAPEEYDFDALNQAEYLLFEHVETKEVEGNPVDGRSLEELVRIRSRFGIPVGLAHNNFQRNFPDTGEAIKKMKENDIFLELCEAEDKGKKAVDGILLQQMMEIRRNFSSAFEVAEMVERLKKEKAEGMVRKKHAEGHQYFFELFEERTWELIRKHGLKLSVSSDSHKGTEIGKSEKVERYLNQYGLAAQLIFPQGIDSAEDRAAAGLLSL